MAVQKMAVGLLLLTVVDGFRVKRKQSKMKEDPVIDPEEDQGSNDDLIRETEEFNGTLPNIIITPGSLHQCHLSQSDCNIRDMTGATLVYPDSENTKCFNGEDFAFLVRPGRSDKLLYYFPNGGACWENPFGLPGGTTICLPGLILGLTVTGLGMGFSNSDRPGNNFADFTFVAPPYCDGSAHVGNTTFNGILGGRPQMGYNNNMATIEWAKRNLDQTLENFVMAGSSAGSLGVMAWSDYLLTTFQYKKASVIVDSYMGVFPGGTQGPTIKNFGVCNLPIWQNFRSECEAENSNIQDLFDFAMAAHPTVAFATIQPKWDLVQRVFYGAIALSFANFRLYMSTTGFYEETNKMLQRYNRHPNHVHYYVDGGFHTFLWFPAYYTATVTGATGLLGDAGRPRLDAWVNSLIEHESVLSQCNGDLERNGGDNLIFKNTRYCDRALHPKALFNRDCFEDNVDYYGNDLHLIFPETASSAKDCQDQCSRDSDCKVFTFNTRKIVHNCYLKRSDAGRRSSSGRISGRASCA